MTDIVVPDFVSDPPLISSGDVAARWLEQTGAVPWARNLNRLQLTERLAASLGTSEKRIEAILVESDFRYSLKYRLLEFDPVPHETEARSRFVHLSKLTYRFRHRHAARVPSAVDPASHPEWTIYLLGKVTPRSETLLQRWVDWQSTWTALKARNPALELRDRMGEVFDSNDFSSWRIGAEKLFEDWLARGTRDPMPFTDLRGIVTQEYYKRLCELRASTDGWFYWNNDVCAVVYVSRGEWKTISANWPSVHDRVCASLKRDKLP